MVLAARSGQATASLLRQRSLALAWARQSSTTGLRSFSSLQLIHQQQQLQLHQNPTPKPWRSHQQQQLRLFSSSINRFASEYIPPSSRSVLEGGASHTGSRLIDVKKVIVIGSGGISIGQAGEFDYSGTSIV